MDSSSPEGTDASSIKPVSSLRAQFENLKKPSEASSGQPIRTTAPAQKRDPSRDAPAATTKLGDKPSISKPRPQPVKTLGQIPTLQPPNVVDRRPTSPSRPILPPPPSPRSILPPSLTVEPPASPPKPRTSFLSVGDSSAFLNPDSVAKPVSPATASRQFKIPSRPLTPTLDPRRSPRLSSSKPPSPPPPRRSAELRRERDSKTVIPPTIVPDRPLIPARNSYIADNTLVKESRREISEETSPFSSPPSSSGTPEKLDSPPPELPARPRTQADNARITKTGPVSFEPPPVHHTVASRRKEKDPEVNGNARRPASPHVTGEQRPTLPARPQTLPGHSTSIVPPRSSRPTYTASPSALDVGASSVAQKRVVSTPTTQFAPPPTRTHGRSMTADRTSNRVPQQFRAPPTNETGRQSPAAVSARAEATTTAVTNLYPDSSNTNRRPPYIKQGVHEIFTKYDPRVFDVAGDLVCASGTFTRVWSLLDGELLMSLSHGEGIRGTSVAFKPANDVSGEGSRVWIGNNFGEVMEADVATQSVVSTKPNIHGRYEVTKIYRHFNELWTLDEAGTLHVWGPDADGMPNLATNPHQSHRVPRGHTFSLVVGDELWHATGKEVRVFHPAADGTTQFQVLLRPLVQDSAGDVTAGTLLTTNLDHVLLGHNDGKVSLYSRQDYSCLRVQNVSTFKINSLAAVGEEIWAGYNNGRISVFDMSQPEWSVKKEWQAHETPVVKILSDRSGLYKLDRYQVLSLGMDNMLRIWDGLLQEDWLESEMKARDAEYCQFDQIGVLVMTWNVGAATPHSLRYSESDAAFIRDLLESSGSPDILVFGFQELVDLEDKTATAKRILKRNKKEGADQDHMSHQYRDWRDFLIRTLDDYMPGSLYHLLQCTTLVGLFTCIFVKADLRDRIRNLSASEVKRGMGGLHGNKGAIAVRFMVDDSSLCFVNCHLAAGQSQASHRHNDIAAILETAIFPSERDPATRLDTCVGGGDGTMIVDHELCVVNGDLNYRIDTMSRDTVVMAVKSNNLAKLLERDQLLVARRRNPAFRLRAFDELPITFAPTYKYDVGTDTYDSSEKRRSPAWCDRLLYRSGGRGGRIEQLDYRRHEVRVSDHRPVTGRFRFVVKRISPKKRAQAWMECQQRWEDLRAAAVDKDRLYYLVHVCGYDEASSRRLVQGRGSIRRQRSPNGNAEGGAR